VSIVTQIIQASSNEVRAAFEQWLASQIENGVRVVVLEGITGAGKTTLTEQPFALGASRQSINIELDDFLRRPVGPGTPYVDAIDRKKLRAAIDAAVVSSPLVVIQGAIAWPIVQPAMLTLSEACIRRAYLKRMMSSRPEIWQDEDAILDPDLWPSTDYHRSIYRYHSDQQPWLTAELIIERAEQ
jgi:hypothetical protein